MLQNYLFRIISLEINGIALDALPILHVLKILYKQFVLYRHMGKLSHIKVKIHEYIFLNTGIGNLDSRNWYELRLCRTMGFFRLIQHPCGQRHFIFLEHIAQVFVVSNLCFYAVCNLLCLRRGNCMGRCCLNMCCNLLIDKLSSLLQQCIRCVSFLNASPLIRHFQRFIRFSLDG